MKTLGLISLCLLISQTLPALEDEKLAAITKAISFSATSSEIKLVGEYVKSKNDFRTPSLIKCVLGVRNLSSFVCGLSPLDSEKIEISFNNSPSERIKELTRSLLAGESLFNVKNLENVEWQEAEQHNRAWGYFVVDKKNFSRISCIFDAKKVDGVWVLTRLMVPLKDAKSGFHIVFDETTSLSSRDAVLASYALSRLGKTNKAKEILLSILKKDPDNIDALVSIGDIYQKIDDSKSKEFYQKALEESSKRMNKQISEMNNTVVTKYRIYRLLGLEDKAKQYKRDIFLKYPELEALIEYIDIQFDAKE